MSVQRSLQTRVIEDTYHLLWQPVVVSLRGVDGALPHVAGRIIDRPDDLTGSHVPLRMVQTIIMSTQNFVHRFADIAQVCRILERSEWKKERVINGGLCAANKTRFPITLSQSSSPEEVSSRLSRQSSTKLFMVVYHHVDEHSSLSLRLRCDTCICRRRRSGTLSTGALGKTKTSVLALDPKDFSVVGRLHGQRLLSLSLRAATSRLVGRDSTATRPSRPGARDKHEYYQAGPIRLALCLFSGDERDLEPWHSEQLPRRRE